MCIAYLTPKIDTRHANACSSLSIFSLYTFWLRLAAFIAELLYAHTKNQTQTSSTLPMDNFREIPVEHMSTYVLGKDCGSLFIYWPEV